ncbi:MAG: hypothetical protein R3E79_59910 [Caldilineaceae bacterium]
MEAWRTVGVSGVTIVESTGFHRRRAYVLGAPCGEHFGVDRTDCGRPLHPLAVVPDVEAAEECLHATESVVGIWMARALAFLLPGRPP